MKEYTFDFKDKKFELKIIKKKKNIKFSTIQIGSKYLYSYFRFPKNNKYILEVTYSIEYFNKNLQVIKNQAFKLSLITSIFIFILSMLFAYYSIKPMKNALNLLNIFLKDLIHDLNTPITSILLNVRISEKEGSSEELDRITLSAKIISSLYKNLEIIQGKSIHEKTLVNINEIISQRINILQKLYPDITFINKVKNLSIMGNKNAFVRILDNILTNASKYNKPKGNVLISSLNNTLIIEDTGIGIKNISKVFDRYYKENERGLGIGMNIVKKLCDELNISISIKSKLNIGTTIKLILN